MRRDINLLLAIFRTSFPIKRPNYNNTIIIKDFQNQKLNFSAVSYELSCCSKVWQFCQLTVWFACFLFLIYFVILQVN